MERNAEDDFDPNALRFDEASQATRAPPDRDPPDAYRKALGLLVRREHSRRELRRKLDAKGADVTAAETALDTLAGQGYQDDTRFAEMLVRTRIGGGYGPQRIRAELGTHGIDDATVTALFDEAAPDWPELAIDALRRRYGARPAKDNAERVKRSHYLLRRGFDGDSIRAAVKHDFED
ncbi:regulatory protein RecX [Chiayiivirga flava]|uniref:Regulatory protein RecX n=1 Tax=Chiayiivirga flava TaxID=659595 RepID=A0A7W8D7K7_9GAMM|nr:regulatory protein RecX [Chiayiivirga flava]MBB5209350.1 regulatory protein [Chiayiivirga flava]